MHTAGRQDDEAIELAFSKRKIEERKAWLAGFEPGTYLDQSVDQISYSDFVNKVRVRSHSSCKAYIACTVLCLQKCHLEDSGNKTWLAGFWPGTTWTRALTRYPSLTSSTRHATAFS